MNYTEDRIEYITSVQFPSIQIKSICYSSDEDEDDQVIAIPLDEEETDNG